VMNSCLLIMRNLCQLGQQNLRSTGNGNQHISRRLSEG
jgi:hypothetical protein